ncbi:Transposon Ty3-I Gag-Pol polyprotein [Mytilus coruscus]|uniref:Transposon Ty3-I Gag-Pol polyprotein n=1 Tax=Mytilus coruscus TaxID=42192 RepID=A0A6J8F0E8_MYTCO|nr:Transposon Ty3-I Gag-Pol polyprotein [Mytilus coruscus]
MQPIGPPKVTLKPEPFSGKDCWEEYLSHFEDCAELGQWGNRTKLLFLAASLRGQARTYYMSLSPDDRRTYQMLTQKLDQRFGSSKHKNRWLSKLEMRRRMPGESIAEVGDDIRQLAQKAYYYLDLAAQESLALNQLFEVITVEMKCRCIDKECQTIADAVDVIERYESILGDGDKKKSTIRAVESKDIEGHMSEKYYQSNLQALQDRIAKLEQGHGNRDTKRANTGRWKRQNAGSIGRELVTEDKRPDIKGEKHIRTGHIGETDDNWDNGFYTNGLIYGFPVNFLIDSGSSASILSIDVYEKLPSNVWCSLIPNKSEIFDVNGNKVFAIGSIILELMLGQEIFSQNFMICNINQDGILGQNFLLKEVSKVNYQRMVLHTIHNQEIQCWIGGKANMICRVEIKDNMTIPPMTSTMMPVEIPGVNHLTEYGFIEGTTGTAKSTLTIPGIINTQDQAHFINVVNYGDNEVKLYKKETIGTCESYAEHHLNPEQIRTLQKDCFTASEEIPEHLTDLLKRSSTYLNEDQRQQLSRLLSQYQNVFSRTDDDIGRTELVTHRINTGNAIPFRQRSRRMPLGKQEMEKSEVNRMLDKRIIEPSSSPWASNIFLVMKKNGSPRCCVDYRILNDVTKKKDFYPIPRVDECLDWLAGGKFFGSMDLNSGFWQIGMAPEDKEKSAFLTSLGLYQFTIMPFGLANSPSTFERLMENVLRGLQWKELSLYMDDIISVSSTFEEGLGRLERIFIRLQNAHLKLKPAKCIFFHKQVRFLGHIVSEEGISTDLEKTKAIDDWPVPKSAKQVRSFLGLCSYYMRFVKRFAAIARPMHKICEKNSRFAWNDECQKAFEQLKNALTSTPVLAYPLQNLPFIPDTDT